MTDDLNKYIQENAKFLKVEENNPIEVIYKGYSIIPDRFNPGKNVVSYLFQYPGTDKNVPWNKASSKVAMTMAKFSAGDKLKITRIGQGPATNYTIEKIA